MVRGIDEIRLTMNLSGECNILGSVSSQQKYEATDVKALCVSQLSARQCYSSRTDQFYLENKEKYVLKAWGHAHPKDEKEREKETESAPAGERKRERDPGPLAPLFICFFPPPGNFPM